MIHPLCECILLTDKDDITMHLVTRAFYYIRKQKAKTVLLLILFFVIADIVSAGLSVQSAAADQIINQTLFIDVVIGN